MFADDFTPLKLFITGPIHLREEVRRAALLPDYGHRDSENEKRFGPIFANLRAIADAGEDYAPIIFNGSGTNCLEASIRSLVRDDETVLNVSMGAFGDLYHKLAVVNGKRAVQLKVEPGRAVDPNVLEDALREHRPDVVTLTHNETSTGVVGDIAACCALVRRYGALPLVDGVSIFGGTDIGLREAAPAMYCTSTQKALGLPAGFGIAFVSAEAREKAATVSARGYTTDILATLDKAAKHQTLTTPNGPLGNQLAVQLDFIVNEEGVQTRYARHERLRDQAHAFVEATSGVDLFAQEGHRSPTVTAVLAPEGWTVARLKALKESMRARGYLFDPGYGKLNTDLESLGKRPVFRIGHMGDMTAELLATYLGELTEELAK